jgi:hypothetical protein
MKTILAGAELEEFLKASQNQFDQTLHELADVEYTVKRSRTAIIKSLHLLGWDDLAGLVVEKRAA